MSTKQNQEAAPRPAQFGLSGTISTRAVVSMIPHRAPQIAKIAPFQCRCTIIAPPNTLAAAAVSPNSMLIRIAAQVVGVAEDNISSAGKFLRWQYPPHRLFLNSRRDADGGEVFVAEQPRFKNRTS